MNKFYHNKQWGCFSSPFLTSIVFFVLLIIVFSMIPPLISANNDCQKKLDEIESMISGQGLKEYENKIKYILLEYKNKKEQIPACILNKLGDYHMAIKKNIEKNEKEPYENIEKNDKEAYKYYKKAFEKNRLPSENFVKMSLARNKYDEALAACLEDRESFGRQIKKMHDIKDIIFSDYLSDMEKGITFFTNLKKAYSTDSEIDKKISQYTNIKNRLNEIPSASAITKDNYNSAKEKIDAAEQALNEITTNNDSNTKEQFVATEQAQIKIPKSIKIKILQAKKKITELELEFQEDKEYYEKLCKKHINELKAMVDEKTQRSLNNRIKCSQSNFNLIENSKTWFGIEQDTQLFSDNTGFLSNLKSFQSEIKESNPLIDPLKTRINYFCTCAKNIAMSGFQEKTSTSVKHALFIRQYFSHLYKQHCGYYKEIEVNEELYQQIVAIGKINTVESLKKKFELIKKLNIDDTLKKKSVLQLSRIGYEKAYKENDFCQKIKWINQTKKMFSYYPGDNKLKEKLNQFEKKIEPVKKELKNLFFRREYILLAKYVVSYNCIESFLDNTNLFHDINKLNINSTSFKQILDDINSDSKYIKNYFLNNAVIAANWIYGNLKESTNENRLAAKHYFLADYYLCQNNQKEYKKEKQPQNNNSCLLSFLNLLNIFKRDEKPAVSLENEIEKLIKNKINLFVQSKRDQEIISELYGNNVNEFTNELSVKLNTIAIQAPPEIERIQFAINLEPYEQVKINYENQYYNYYLKNYLIEKAYDVQSILKDKGDYENTLEELYNLLRKIDNKNKVKATGWKIKFNKLYKENLNYDKTKYFGYAFWRMSEGKYTKALFDDNFYKFLELINKKKVFNDVLFETCLIINDKEKVKKILNCNIDDPINCKKCSSRCKKIERKTRKKIETLAITLIEISKMIKQNWDEHRKDTIVKEIKNKLFINIHMNQDVLFSNLGIKIALENMLKSNQNSKDRESVRAIIKSYINSNYWRE